MNQFLERLKRFIESKPLIVWWMIMFNMAVIIRGFYVFEEKMPCNKNGNLVLGYSLLLMLLLLFNTMLLIDLPTSTAKNKESIPNV
jgi:hypothetical protein